MGGTYILFFFIQNGANSSQSLLMVPRTPLLKILKNLFLYPLTLILAAWLQI
jgi:hypothetical protein